MAIRPQYAFPSDSFHTPIILNIIPRLLSSFLALRLLPCTSLSLKIATCAFATDCYKGIYAIPISDRYIIIIPSVEFFECQVFCDVCFALVQPFILSAVVGFVVCNRSAYPATTRRIILSSQHTAWLTYEML